MCIPIIHCCFLGTSNDLPSFINYCNSKSQLYSILQFIHSTYSHSLAWSVTKLSQKGRTHTLEKVQVNGKKIGFGVRGGFQSLFHPLPSGWPCASYGHLQTSSVTWGLPIPTITRFSWWLNEVIINSFQHTHVLITVSSFLLPSPLPPTLKNLAPCAFLHANVNFALPPSNQIFWLKNSCGTVLACVAQLVGMRVSLFYVSHGYSLHFSPSNQGKELHSPISFYRKSNHSQNFMICMYKVCWKFRSHRQKRCGEDIIPPLVLAKKTGTWVKGWWINRGFWRETEIYLPGAACLHCKGC